MSSKLNHYTAYWKCRGDGWIHREDIYCYTLMQAIHISKSAGINKDRDFVFIGFSKTAAAETIKI